jgi:hypothetical protein
LAASGVIAMNRGRHGILLSLPAGVAARPSEDSVNDSTDLALDAEIIGGHQIVAERG